jgi:hypothetical protein
MKVLLFSRKYKKTSGKLQHMLGQWTLLFRDVKEDSKDFLKYLPQGIRKKDHRITKNKILLSGCFFNLLQKASFIKLKWKLCPNLNLERDWPRDRFQKFDQNGQS